MSPEKITTSLEMSKRLKEAEWVGSEHFLWAYHCFDYPDDSVAQKPFLTCREEEDHYHQWEFYDAPTAGEILQRLPYSLPWKDDSDNVATLFINRFPSSYRVGYSPQWTQDAWSSPDGETLADAAASCWIYLSQNNLLPQS